jgi:SAM-dependent methyltransferase
VLLRNPYHFVKYRIVRNLRRAADFRLARRRMLRSPTGAADEQRLLAGVSLRTHLDDRMYAGSAAHYLAVGLSAVRVIDQVLGEIGKPPQAVRTILDFPSGYGRVLRFLKVRFPHAAITAAELDREALEFCRRAFSVRTAASRPALSTLDDIGTFDLIWCGSLLTHLDRGASRDLLAFLRRQLAAGGVCLLTTHGPRSAEWIADGSETYLLSPAARRELLTQFREAGHGYVDYDGRRGYGISLISSARMLGLAAEVGNWNNACYLEHAWLDHQDVYAFVAGNRA